MSQNRNTQQVQPKSNGVVPSSTQKQTVQQKNDGPKQPTQKNDGPKQQQKNDGPVTQSDLDSLTKKVKTNFTLLLVNFGISFSIFVAVVITFTQVYQDLDTLKNDMLEIQSRGEALQKNLKPLEAAIQSLGISGTTPTTAPQPNTNSA